MAIELAEALAQVRAALADPASLISASASGAVRGAPPPAWRRVELRPVQVRGRLALQIVRYDETQAHTANAEVTESGSELGAAIDEVLAEPFAHWHVRTTGFELEARATRRGGALVNRRRVELPAAALRHDRDKERLLPADAPVLRALGIADDAGRIKPSRQDKYRQVEEFLRALAATVDEGRRAGALAEPSGGRPWQLVDLGCGNGYLTFAAQAWLAGQGLPTVVTGVDVKEQSCAHNTAVADELGVGASTRFVVGTIADAPLPDRIDIALALHACDTATDEALARAVRAGSGVILAAPCCHHDLARQLRAVGAPAGYEALIGDGILRERFADTLTDALRACLVRAEGYRVSVVDFVDSRHTPRNTLLRCVRTGHRTAQAAAAASELAQRWSVTPALAPLLGDDRRAGVGGR